MKRRNNMPFDPWKGMSAAEMEKMRLENPAEFARLSAMLESPNPNSKTMQYRNGLVVFGDVPRPE
jgi:hypothetical protein